MAGDADGAVSSGHQLPSVAASSPALVSRSLRAARLGSSPARSEAADAGSVATYPAIGIGDPPACSMWLT